MSTPPQRVRIFIASLILILIATPSHAQRPSHKLNIKLSKDRWTTLVLLRRANPSPEPIRDSIPLQSVEELEFSGPQVDHPHLLGNFKIDGRFVIQFGILKPSQGNSTLLQLPSAESFILEGNVLMKGAGGWLILFGWDEKECSGYCLYHTQLKTSGAPWRICRIENGAAVKGSEVELLKEQKMDGAGAFLMSIVDGKLSLVIQKHQIADDFNLTNYQGGAIMMGTYNPRYGPKEFGINSLRMKGW